MRDYCKNLIYDIVKTCLKNFSINFYDILKKMLKNLNNIYIEYNFISKSKIKLYNFKFFINIIKKNKIFDEFLTRFILIIFSFDFTKRYKIIKFIRFIFNRLR